MTTARPQRRRRAQRGNGDQLRNEIVAATKNLLAAAGRADDVSIRAVAEVVGVTPPSIYLHFADKDELINAVVADVFTELDVAMQSAAAEAKSPLERLRAHGLAYVHFAVTHPEHYRLATMEPRTAPPEADEVIASSAFVHFTSTITECMDAGIFAAGDPVPIALELWAVAHGVAALVIAKPYLPWRAVEAVADGALRSAAIGRSVADLIGDPDAAEFTAWLTRQQRSG
jgi:AcrR family transcriptional regulator